MRRITDSHLVIASHNQGKVREISALLAPYGIQVSSAADHGLEEPEETEDSFIGNAILKARATAQATGHLALADDSGFVVSALDGRPGIYSARWAGPNKDFQLAMQRVLDEVADKNTYDRSAAFICALALVWPDGHHESFEGRVDGQLAPAPRGEGGFGYDPLFIPEGDTRSYGEMSMDEKMATNHRARAFDQLVTACLPASVQP